MQEVGMFVKITIPDSMEPRQACDEVRTSIGFGRPRISLEYVRMNIKNDPGGEVTSQ